MPARNAELFIERAIESTLSAMPRDAELIVLDDASEDRTAERALRAARGDSRMRLLSSEGRGLGVAGGLNKLLGSSDSKFIARMDADDVCLPWRFRMQRRRMERSDFTFSSVIRIDGRGWPVIGSPFPQSMGATVVPLALLLGNVLVHPTMYATRSAIIESGGYRESASEDYDLWLRVAASSLRIEMVPIPSLLYRTHPGQLSNTPSWRAVSADSILLESFVGLAHTRLGVTLTPRRTTGWSGAGLSRFVPETELEKFWESFVREERELAPLDRLLLGARRRKRHRILKSTAVSNE